MKPRIAVRALILDQDRLLLVNAFAGNRSDLWCAPGGGVHSGASLPNNLIREVHEETGLTIAPGPMVLVNEFHDPSSGFHQIDIYFRATVIAGQLDPAWRDPERVVNRHVLASRAQMESGEIRFKPDLLIEAAWGDAVGLYDPLEPIAR